MKRCSFCINCRTIRNYHSMYADYLVKYPSEANAKWVTKELKKDSATLPCFNFVIDQEEIERIQTKELMQEAGQ